METLSVEDLDAAIEEFKTRGYRLDMIFPADDPREAVVSVTRALAGGLPRPSIRLVVRGDNVQPPATAGGTDARPDEWIRGRAGMEYRDLIPGRLGGKVIASHIRLTEAGEVNDYVHFHKIDFQVIYCLQGRIKVVYEDQGEPFWMEAGDLVLQPPQIRHRVLECTAGAEVIEITSPAEHETWVEDEIQLPTATIDHDRLFGERRFFRHIAGNSDARDDLEIGLVRLADELSRARSDEQRLGVVTTFSQTLCQT